jgi:hypothetical protein
MVHIRAETADRTTVTSTRRGALLLLPFAGFAVLLHLVAGNTFPVPWVDEIDFLAPAHALAHHGTLRVPSLSAPHGMYWVSDVYYFLLAPVVRFLPATVTVGRSVSLVAMLLAALGFWTAGRKAGVPPVIASILVGAWLLTPKVVVAANITRHEAIVLAVVAWGLVAVVSQRRLAGLTAAAFAVVLHPAGAPFAAVIALGALVLPAKRPTRWEWAGASALTAVCAFEAVHFAGNWDVASEQIRFQLNRKADRVTPARDYWFVAGFAAALYATIRSWALPYRLAGLFAGSAMAGAVISSFGHEMWYGVYGLPTGLLLMALAVATLAPEVHIVSASALQLATAAVVVLTTFGAANFTDSFYEMHINDSKTEWTAFVAKVETQLQAFDSSAPQPTTLALNELSDLPWPLVDAPLTHTTIVKETAVTKSDEATYQLVCCRENVPASHDVGEVVATIHSPHGEFTAQLVKIGR